MNKLISLLAINGLGNLLGICVHLYTFDSMQLVFCCMPFPFMKNCVAGFACCGRKDSEIQYSSVIIKIVCFVTLFVVTDCMIVENRT